MLVSLVLFSSSFPSLLSGHSSVLENFLSAIIQPVVGHQVGRGVKIHCKKTKTCKAIPNRSSIHNYGLRTITVQMWRKDHYTGKGITLF